MKAPGFWRGLRRSERLTTGFLLLLTGLTVLARPAAWPALALGFTGLLLLVAGLSRIQIGCSLRLVRDFVPAVVVLGIFLLLQPLVAAVNAHRWDAALAAADARWFPGLAASWRGVCGRPPLLTDLLYLAYVSFYALPLCVAGLFRARSGSQAFEAMAFTLLLGFFLSFLGYFLWPAEGPRVPELLEASALGGGAVSQGIRTFLRAAEHTTLDAFPSGHTALSVLPALLASRTFKWKAWPFYVWAFAILFATVYVSAHYVVDLLAGLGLAGVTLGLAGPLYRRMGPPPDP